MMPEALSVLNASLTHFEYTLSAGRALEVFLKDLCEGASDIAVERQARTLTPGHMYVLPRCCFAHPNHRCEHSKQMQEALCS